MSHPVRLTRRAALATAAAAAAGAEPTRPAVEGYAGVGSVTPGEAVPVHVSATGAFAVEVARVGRRREVMWTLDRQPGRAYPIPENASATGCGWPAAFAVPVGKGWPSGYYEGRFLVADRQVGTFFFVVRPATPTAAVLLPLSTNTYNAYTNWAGYSLYAYHGRDKVQGRRVSFDRPQASQFPTWEQPFVAWAEANNVPLDFATNLDLERPGMLKGYKLVLSVGHDEYWSAGMRDAAEAYIAGGGNYAFFSGNTCCWQVRPEANGRQLVCWKQSFGDDPVYRSGDRRTLSTLWSHHLVGRPETTLTGVGFLWGGYHKSHGQFMDGSGAYTAHRPDHWLLDGTGLKRGDAFGGKDTVVGYECDGCELEWKDGVPSPTHRDGCPPGFEVVATAPARWHPDDCEWYERWPKGRTGNAVLGTYTRGGTVVTVGSTDWSHGLRGNDPAVVRVTRNVLAKLAGVG